MALQKSPTITIQPLTSQRWDDFLNIMGERGAVGGCWCMYLRLTNREFEAQKGESNRRAMEEIVNSGRVPGLLAYVDNQPAGWCSVAPREEFERLKTSRVAKPLDEQPVWSLVCLFIAKPYRRQGLSVALIKAAVEYAKSQGARIIEGYPVEPKDGKSPDAFVWWGTASAFREAGFVEVARRTPTRPMMRYEVE